MRRAPKFAFVAMVSAIVASRVLFAAEPKPIDLTSLDKIKSAPRPIPVILDTDIGNDIDDAWALGFLLKSPELDLKLVLGDHGKSEYRAKMLAKFLTDAKRTDVPIGIGMEVPGIKTTGSESNASLVENFTLKEYAGIIKPDGVQALIDLVMSSSEIVTLICIGPLDNIGEALRRQPEIVHKIRFVGMLGSVRCGQTPDKPPYPECNLTGALQASKAVFAAPWSLTFTPSDTSGVVYLRGEDYKAVRDSSDPVAKAIMTQYRNWKPSFRKFDFARTEYETTTLWDTVAVYLAFSQAGLKMEALPIIVTDKGMTVIQEGAPLRSVATEWTDREEFQHFLSKRLSGSK